MQTIQVNLDNATIGDLRLFDKWKRDDYEIGEILEFLDRLCDTGNGSIESLPLTRLGDIMGAVEDAMDASVLATEKN